MSRQIDIHGQKFGRLTALYYLSDYKWFCQCNCGNMTSVKSNALRSGKTKSCGCYNKDVARKNMTKTIGRGVDNRNYIQDRRAAGLRQTIATYKLGAKNRSLEFSLSEEFAMKLMSEDCYYCGKEPANSKRDKILAEPILYNGIDRVDNGRGYVPDNCVSCCRSCNIAKSDMGFNEFIQWVSNVFYRRVYEAT